MEELATRFTDFFGFFFALRPVSNINNNFLQRFSLYIVDDPLIMAVIAMFFAGFIVSLFIRLFHSS